MKATAGLRCILLPFLRSRFQPLRGIRWGCKIPLFDAALSEKWLGKTGIVEEFYRQYSAIALSQANRFGSLKQPRPPAEATAGPQPIFDSFRYLNQLGTLAKRGVQVSIHNTLAASDYALN